MLVLASHSVDPVIAAIQALAVFCVLALLLRWPRSPVFPTVIVGGVVFGVDTRSGRLSLR